MFWRIDDSRYIGTLVALAVVLVLCVTFFSIALLIVSKAKTRIQAQLGANIDNAVVINKTSVKSHVPHEVKMDINENVAYGVPVHLLHEKGN